MEDCVEMPSQAQEFCLKWNNFQASLVSAIDGFKNDQEFVDVTIACEGKLLKAHKMLLSACSIFFRDIFKDITQHQHPVIVLPGDVKFHDLEKILTFIYQGEVNVQQENLPRFLKTAEMLKIRGLAEDHEKKAVKRSTLSPKFDDSGAPLPKRRKLSEVPAVFSGGDLFSPPADDTSQHSNGDAVGSDTDMIPVKQEMIELKEIDFESTDAETFIADALLKEVAPPTPSSSSSGKPHSSVPPPPGPLLPSYIPPALVKNQDVSPLADIGVCKTVQTGRGRPKLALNGHFYTMRGKSMHKTTRIESCYWRCEKRCCNATAVTFYQGNCHFLKSQTADHTCGFAVR